jgi:hypothetical protein
MHDFTVNQVQVSNIQSLDSNMQTTTTTRVTFYVGKDGPFILFYKQSDYNAEKVAADINHQVATLQAIKSAVS